MKDEQNSPTPLIPRRPSAHINAQSERPLHEKVRHSHSHAYNGCGKCHLASNVVSKAAMCCIEY